MRYVTCFSTKSLHWTGPIQTSHDWVVPRPPGHLWLLVSKLGTTGVHGVLDPACLHMVHTVPRAPAELGSCVGFVSSWASASWGPSGATPTTDFGLGWSRGAPMLLFCKAKVRTSAVKLSMDQLMFLTYLQWTLMGFHKNWIDLRTSWNSQWMTLVFLIKFKVKLKSERVLWGRLLSRSQDLARWEEVNDRTTLSAQLILGWSGPLIPRYGVK